MRAQYYPIYQGHYSSPQIVCLNERLLLKWVQTYEKNKDLKCVQMSASKYRATSHLNHRCQRYKLSIMLRTSLMRWEIKRSNYWEDELYFRDECGTKHNRHSPAIPRDWTLSQVVLVLVQTCGISRSHLNHRCQSYEISTMLKKSRISRSSMEGFRPWKEILSISWFELLKSLVWWENQRNNYKL